MRRWRMCLVLALVTVAGRHAIAQHLDLDAGQSPPALGLDTYAGQCMGVLRGEIEELSGRAPDGGPSEAEILRASINVRGVAGKLLDQGDRSPSEGSLLFLSGLCLFRGRHALDGALERIGELEAATDPEAHRTFDAALDGLRRFNDQAPRLGSVPATERQLDRRVADVIRPLADAIAAASGNSPVTHWVAAREVAWAGSGGGSGASSADEALRRLTEELESAPLQRGTIDALLAIADVLRRGAAFEEYRLRVESYVALLLGLVELAEAVWAADWLEASGREAYRRAIHEAVVSFGSRETRDDGQQQLARLVATRGIVAGITELSSAPPVSVPGRGRDEESSQRAGRLARMRSALLSALDANDASALKTDTLEEALDRMIAYRALPTTRLPAELRRTWRKLDEAYLRSEESIAARAVDLLAPAALADPDLASLVAQHRQYLEDLQRFEKLPAWTETARRLAPRAAGPFSAQVRTLITRLADPIRRAEAVAELARLEDELAAFAPLPFEVELRRGERSAIIATGGRHGELVEAIDAARVRWVEAWGEGDGTAAGRMRLLHRLLVTMADTSTLLGAQDGRLLNRWAAWELDPMTIERNVANLTNRLKLAATAAVEGDDGAVRRQLERIEAPPAALAGRLAAALNRSLDALPGGALSVVGQLVHPPTPESWMAGRRRELAELCRYTMELQQARATGRDELARKLSLHVNSLALDLLDATCVP